MRADGGGLGQPRGGARTDGVPNARSTASLPWSLASTKAHAAEHHQTHRADLFHRLLTHIDEQAS